MLYRQLQLSSRLDHPLPLHPQVLLRFCLELPALRTPQWQLHLVAAPPRSSKHRHQFELQTHLVAYLTRHSDRQCLHSNDLVCRLALFGIQLQWTRRFAQRVRRLAQLQRH